MKTVSRKLIYFVLLFNQSLIFTMDQNQFIVFQHQLANAHRKKTDENARNAFKELQENVALKIEKQKALEKKQKNNDDGTCVCIIS